MVALAAATTTGPAAATQRVAETDPAPATEALTSARSDDGETGGDPEPLLEAQSIPCDGSQTVGLLQDNVPWAAAPDQDPLGANATELALMGADFCVFTSAELSHLDLAPFSTIVISSAQTQTFYDNLFPGGAVHTAISHWVQAGGMLVAHLADTASGPGGGSWSGRTFVSGLTQVPDTVDDNNIIASTHPVVSPSDPCPSGNCGQLVDVGHLEDLDGWGWSSHGHFTNLPSGTTIVLGGPNASSPVYVQYPHGAGTVLATMTTIEWRYVGGFGGLPQNKTLLANELAYALGVVSPITLSPASERSPAIEDLWHSVTATVVDPDTGSPQRLVEVEFSVEDGPNTDVVGRCRRPLLVFLTIEGNTCQTDLFGNAVWYYAYQHPTGSDLGTDEIRAEADLDVPATATATKDWLEPVDYAALGDSFSSGLGTRSYFSEVPDCKRATRAYATLAKPPGYGETVYDYWLETDGEVGWRFVACQGARIPHIVTDAQFGEPPQVDRLDDDVNMLTMTIGGNDAGFSSVIRSCMTRACVDREWEDTGQTLREWLPEKITSLQPNLVAAYQDLLDAADGAPLFVLGYPHLVPAGEDEQGCFKLRPWRAEMDFFREMSDLMDDVLAAAAAQAGVHFVNVSDHFAGHEICGNGGEWVNGPSLPLDESFHPNVSGQAEYAARLNGFMVQLVNLGADTEETGVPANPGAGGGAFGAMDGLDGPEASDNGQALPTLGELRVEPMEEQPLEACPGVVRPGTDVRLTGEGFDPHSQVTVVSEHDEDVVPLGTATADANGDIDVVVTVPATFDPPPVADPLDIWQTETVVGFEIRGADPDGVERMLLGVAGLSHDHLLCDITPPSIELLAPQDGAVYSVEETVLAEYSCTDEPGGSGIAECVGDLPSGTAIDTSLPGTFRFTVLAVDQHGNATQVTATYTVEFPTAPLSLDGGTQHSLATALDGSVWAWGGNTWGQLGDGTTTGSTVPVPVGLDALEVAAGGYHSLAIGLDGTVSAWGRGSFGQLGDGGTADSSTPVTVSGIADAVAITGGNYHSLAVTAGGDAWAWGYNGTGQLGDGTTTSRSTPVQVSGLTDAVAVAAGGLPGWSGHSLALRADGTVWAWGYNKEGQLGDGTRTHRFTPVQVTGLDEVVAIAADGDASYALRADGTVWAWGDNRYDQLGPAAGRRSTVPVAVPIDDAVAIAAGGTHAFAVRADGTAWAWGNNNTGQLGHDQCGPGTPKTVPEPVQVATLTATVTLAGGYVHSLALTDDATAWGWGNNGSGQVGDGTTAARCAPAQVTGFDQVP